MSEKMIEKFNMYWSLLQGIKGVAAVLDPRYKLVLLEYYFPKIYESVDEYEVEKILMLCSDLIHQYEDKEKLKGDSDTMEMSSIVADNMFSLSEFDLYPSKKKRKSARSELDQYLDEDVLPYTSDFDVVSWWKSYKRKNYPVLHQIDRDILAIPVPTVLSESAFSMIGRIVGPHCSRLQPNTIEALMCAQNWLSTDLGGLH